MGQIKSALEMALERTKDIVEDRSGLVARELKEKGMKLVVSYENDPSFEIDKALKAFNKEEKALVLSGIRQNIEGILALPANEDALNRFKRLAPLLVILSGTSAIVQEYVQQLDGFFKRYLDNKNQMFEAARAQFEPALRKKEEAMARQTGRRVQLHAEQDPEFNKFMNQNLEGLQAQFNQALDQVRAQVYAELDWQ